ncbi:MAG: hypothetical protein D6735_15385 [Acidobacteria bacterium]|nr:MAG: hypothetical protein D6735_15385 [Acidobacteriota bacterium]
MIPAYIDIENEMNSLQIVDYIFSSIERKKGSHYPQKFDIAALKKRVKKLIDSRSIKDAAEQLIQEESIVNEEIARWCVLLTQRDKGITGVDLMLYCEQSKPPLNTQAILSLIRFYLELPFSEAIRVKLDVLMTMLFSFRVKKGKRQLSHSPNEIKLKLEEYYESFPNAPNFSEEEQRKLKVAVEKFREFVSIAQNSRDLDALISSKLHEEIIRFKQQLGEDFLEPSVLAAAIECNVLVGNIYTDLLLQKKDLADVTDVSMKYPVLGQQKFLEAVVHNINSPDLFDSNTEAIDSKEITDGKETDLELQIRLNSKKAKKVRKSANTSKTKVATLEFSSKIEHKWLIALLVIIVFLGIALYSYVEFLSSDVKKVAAQPISLENTEFKEYIKMGKVNNELFIGVVTDKWTQLSEDEKRKLVEKLLALGKSQQFNKVYLLNNNGLTVASGADSNIEISER